MNIIVIIILFFLAFIFYFFERKIYYPPFIFCILYGTILLLDGLHLYGTYSSQDSTYLLILLGVLSFCIGFVFCKKVFVSSREALLSKSEEQYSIRFTLYKILLLFSIIMSIYPAFKNLSALLNSSLSFSTIREDFGTYYNNHILNLIYNYIVNPIVNSSLALTPIIVFDTNVKKKNKIEVLVLTIVIIIFNVIMNAGRGILLYFLIMVFFSYKIFDKRILLNQEQKLKRKKLKRLCIFIFLGAIGGYILVTRFRGGSTNSALAKQLYVYASGCIPFLDNRISLIETSNICLYGTGGFHGIFQFVFTMLDNFGLISYPNFMTVSDLWYNNSLTYASIGTNVQFNAYATLFYNSYLDGGFLAVIIEMLIYGGLLGFLYKKITINLNNKRAISIFVYLLYGLCFSFVRFQFSLQGHWLAILVLILLTYRNKEKKSKWLLCK